MKTLTVVYTYIVCARHIQTAEDHAKRYRPDLKAARGKLTDRERLRVKDCYFCLREASDIQETDA